MQLSFNSYDDIPEVKIPIADKAIKRKENFNWTIKISDAYKLVIGQTGTSPLGSFIVKNISYVSAGTMEVSLTTFPSNSSISKVKVIGQSKDMPGENYTANFALPEIKTYSKYQTLKGIPSDWFTDHLMVHSSIKPSKLSEIVSARKEYVSDINDLLHKVAGGEDGVFTTLLKVSESGKKLIQVGDDVSSNDSAPGIHGIGDLSFAGPMSGFTNSAYGWSSEGGNGVNDLGTYARDLASIYNTPMSFPSANAISGVYGYDYLVTDNISVTLSDFEVMSGEATIQIGTHTITLDLTKLPLDAQTTDITESNKRVLNIQMLARNDYRVNGSTYLVVNYGWGGNDNDGSFDINKPIDTSITIPNQKVNIGENAFVSAALASLQVPFNGMSTIEMSMTVVKSYLEDAYSYGAGKNKIDTKSIGSLVASIGAVVGVFAISPVAGAGLGAILLAMAIESNIPVLRRGELDKLAGGVLAQYGIAKSQINLEGDVPRQPNGANRARGGLDLYYTSNTHANTSVPKIITTTYVYGDYKKWATRPRELRQPITRPKVSDYPTPFSYWGVEAITTTPDPQVKQALSYLNTGDI